jgi:hypothetical protein
MMNFKFAAASRQRGVVLIFSLLVLLILAIGAVAVLRSVHTSLLSAGNLAFHRDLVNQAEQAVSNVMIAFKTNAPPLSGVTTADLPAANYSSSALPTNAQGVPTALLDNTAFAAVGIPGNDITGATGAPRTATPPSRRRPPRSIASACASMGRAVLKPSCKPPSPNRTNSYE